jgi:peptide/nickel transport system permease protein
MSQYIVRRLGFLALTVLLTSLVIFLITQWLPGDIARVILGREASEPALNNLRQELGLNHPLAGQYARWLGGFLTGDWGTSYSTGLPIRPLVVERLGNSLMLAALTMVIAIPLSVTLGVVAGLNEGKWADNLISLGSLLVVGLPEFVTGLVLIEIFAFRLHWLPANSSIRPGATFFEALPQLILPAITATLVLLAYGVRLSRAGVLEELKQAYVRTAILNGVCPNAPSFKHVLRNALLPTINRHAISLAGLSVVDCHLRMFQLSRPGSAADVAYRPPGYSVCSQAVTL